MKKDNNDIISRRKFFKKAAGVVIPAIALTALPNLLSSCEIDEEELPKTNTGCSACKGTCGTSCATSCSDKCSYSGCKSQCTTTCSGTCVSSCSVGCSRSSLYSH